MAMGERRINQICSHDGKLYAVCDDGTLWNYELMNWWLVKQIPQIDIKDYKPPSDVVVGAW
jgi:hypothetical protein